MVNQQLALLANNSHSTLILAGQSAGGIQEVQNLLLQVSRGVADLQFQKSIEGRQLSGATELDVIIEDALGQRTRLPSEWVDIIEWEVSLQCVYKGVCR